MGFLSFALFVLTVYVRPGEVIEAWRGAPVAQILLPVCGLLSVGSVLFRQGFKVVPADVFVAGFLAAAVMSDLANGWAGGVVIVLLTLGPSVIGYYVTRVAIRSASGMQTAALLIVVLSAFLAGNGLIQYYTGKGLGEVEALTHTQQADEGQSGENYQGDVPEVRIRGTGIFNDPNDLAFALVIGAPLNLFLMMRARSIVRRSALGVSFAAIVFAIVLTRSRGGLVGLAIAMGVMLKRRFGTVVASLAVAVGVAVFVAMGSGRVTEFNASESSAQGRIEAWAAGIHMLRTHPLFGVGYGAFTDYHELVAHNSYVHVFAELGLVGGQIFMALVGSFVLSRRRGPTQALDENVALAWQAAGLGGLICCWFLSRQYSPSLFILFALGATTTELKGLESTLRDYVLYVTVTTGVLVAVYVSILALQGP